MHTCQGSDFLQILELKRSPTFSFCERSSWMMLTGLRQRHFPRYGFGGWRVCSVALHFSSALLGFFWTTKKFSATLDSPGPVSCSCWLCMSWMLLTKEHSFHELYLKLAKDRLHKLVLYLVGKVKDTQQLDINNHICRCCSQILMDTVNPIIAVCSALLMRNSPKNFADDPHEWLRQITV